jgi:hypothetical protein
MTMSSSEGAVITADTISTGIHSATAEAPTEAGEAFMVSVAAVVAEADMVVVAADRMLAIAFYTNA